MLDEKKYEEVKNILLEKLDTELNPKYLYHSVDHTLDVIDRVEYIGRQEDISPSGMLLLKFAALFHDSGFLRTYEGHEEESVRIAETFLKDVELSPEEKSNLKELILATKLGYSPKQKLEMIIIDADLDYLGRDDFPLISQKLFMEWRNIGIVADLQTFYKKQIRFLENHEYYTETSKKMREEKKNHHIKKLKELLLSDN